MYKLVRRNDKMVDADKVFVALHPQHITFNRNFARILGLKHGDRVRHYADDESFKIAFELTTDVTDSFSISMDGGNHWCGYGELKQKAWVVEATKLGIHQRRFEPKKVVTEFGKLWEITLCPCFETKRARESGELPLP